MTPNQHIIGIIGGASPKPFVEALKTRLSQATNAQGERITVLAESLEWSPPEANCGPLVLNGDKKIRAFEEMNKLVNAGAYVVAFPCFEALNYFDELQTEFTTPLANVCKAISLSLKEESQPLRVGILCSSALAKNEAFERYLGVKDFEILYPSKKQQDNLDEALSLLTKKNSPPLNKQDSVVELLKSVCAELKAQGATVIVPAHGDILLAAPFLREMGEPLLDVVDSYAKYLCSTEWTKLPKPFKVGLVGGLGPAATVDLYDKIVRATPAKSDQEHFKVVVEQNPQVPDRTQYLLKGGVDPTLALFSVCKKLEADGVDAIVIPCNTAHAFFDTIAPHLSVPIINMQQVALEEIQTKFGRDVQIGLLATNGTIQSGIYHKKVESMGMKICTPDPEYQTLVMSAIYGEKGAKAGFTDGVCREELLKAAKHLAFDKGAKALILGCTELPLILDECDSFDLDGQQVAFVDPTAALARRVVAVAKEISSIRGRL